MQRQTLSALERIRVLINSGPGSGTQSASINLMRYLVDRGFNGIFEVIHAAPIKPIIASLLDADESQLNTVYNDGKLHIEFIELNDMVNNRHSDKLPELHLGVTGAIEGVPGFLRSPYEEGYVPFNSSILEEEAKNNFAVFLNVTSFICFDSYTSEYSDTYIDHKNNNHSLQIGSGKKISFYPPYHIRDAIEYLIHNKKGQLLTEQLPALLPLIELINKNLINFIPVYGRGTGGIEDIRFFYQAAQYAQIHGGLPFQKPIVIGMFSKPVLNGSNIVTLKDKTFIEQLKTEKDTAYILFSERMPSIVFNAIASHPNVLSPIFEGTGSFNSLVLSGKAHLHWKIMSKWPLISRNITDSLRERFIKLNKIRELIPRSLIDEWPLISENLAEAVYREPDFINFDNMSKLILKRYEDKIKSESEQYLESTVNVVGEYFIDSKRKSEVSDYFTDLRQEALNEDRFAHGLEAVVKLDPLSESYQAPLNPSDVMRVHHQHETLQSNPTHLFGVGTIALAGVLFYGLFGGCRRKHQQKNYRDNKNNKAEFSSRLEK